MAEGQKSAMPSQTVVIGQSGEVIIPPRLRAAHHLETGAELEIESTPAGLLLRPAAARRGVRLEDLRGLLKTDVPTVTLDDLCRPADYSGDWLHPDSAGDNAAAEPEKRHDAA